MAAAKAQGKLLKFRLTYKGVEKNKDGTVKSQAGWRLAIEGVDGYSHYLRKSDALSEAKIQARSFGDAAKAGEKPGYRGASVLAQKKGGREFVAEFTYPRSADPRSSRG